MEAVFWEHTKFKTLEIIIIILKTLQVTKYVSCLRFNSKP